MTTTTGTASAAPTYVRIGSAWTRHIVREDSGRTFCGKAIERKVAASEGGAICKSCDTKAVGATPKLTPTQFKTAVTVLGLAALSEDGEVSEYDARTNGAHLTALRALVDKGVLHVRRGDFVMPTGPYAGETLTGQAFYSAA